ncbi:MAG: pyrrolysine--tRNA(Pyl) ligase large subunit [Deltaproteobacteria bacterium]|jgi:phenylalanyl-tRNA synthetase alpha chain|nr:pyrrolysine--tRNA(Pyl) ligase large subunit [Deltaproteobacteria bacterium]
MEWSTEQIKRLSDLGDFCFPPGDFSDQLSANLAFQKREKDLSKENARGIQEILTERERPEGVLLRERLAAALSLAGFTQVETPLLVSRKDLERMGLSQDNPLWEQIFWVERNRAIRPMLAPNLYHLLVDLLRITNGRVSIFEIGACMRKESQGARHGEEFTMLNVVEMNLKEEERLERLKEIATIVLKGAGLDIQRCSIELEESGVYGETLDVLSSSGLELASTAMGPHALDSFWGIQVPWVGLGFGVERIIMALSEERGKPLNLRRAGRSLTHLGGFSLKIPRGKLR